MPTQINIIVKEPTEATGFVGPIAIIDIPTKNGAYLAVESGTYINAGNLVVDLTAGITYIIVSGNLLIFKKVVYPFIVPASKIQAWIAKAYLSGDQVNHLGKDWVSNAATLSTDIPGTSSKWVERLSAYAVNNNLYRGIIDNNVSLWKQNSLLPDLTDLRRVVLSLNLTLKSNITQLKGEVLKVDISTANLLVSISIDGVRGDATAVKTAENIQTITVDTTLYTAIISIDKSVLNTNNVNTLATELQGKIKDEIIRGAYSAYLSSAKGLIDSERNKYTISGTLTSPVTNRTAIVTVPFYKEIQINAIRVNMEVGGIITVGVFQLISGTTFKLIQSVELTTRKGDSAYKLPTALTGLKGYYFGIVAKNGSRYRARIELAENRTYVYTNIPVIGVNFASTLAGNEYVYTSYMEDISITERINVIENVTPTILMSNGLAKVTNLKNNNPIYIPDPYSYNEFLHPNVLFFSAGLFGFKYWMAVTPMPISGTPYPDRFENPCIYCSNDGVNWGAPVGLSNPIDDLSPSEITAVDYMSDPVLCWKQSTGELECWYRITRVQDANHTYILRKKTTDGVNWSVREIMIDCNVLHMVRSQKVLWDNVIGKYKMWYTGGTLGSFVVYNESVDGFNWTSQTAVTGISTAWHLDLTVKDGVYYLIVYGTSGTNQDGFIDIYSSVNGLAFTFIKRILEPEPSTWYDAGIYKSTLLHNGRDWVVWFSGETLSKRHIGMMIGKDLLNLKIMDGNYTPYTSVIQGKLKLINNAVSNTIIELSDDGYCLGFDYSEKVLFIQKPDGTRKPIG